MEPGTVVVAVIAAIGVILSSVIQRRTNADNLRAAERREEALREDARAQREHDQAEVSRRLEIEREERQAAWDREDRAELAARKRAHQDLWRKERLKAHSNAMSALSEMQEATMLAAYLPGAGDAERLERGANSVTEAQSNVALYCSPEAMSAYEGARKVVVNMRMMEIQRLMEVGPYADGATPTPEARWRELRTDLQVATEKYLRAAKADLGTDA